MYLSFRERKLSRLNACRSTMPAYLYHGFFLPWFFRALYGEAWVYHYFFMLLAHNCKVWYYRTYNEIFNTISIHWCSHMCDMKWCENLRPSYCNLQWNAPVFLSLLWNCCLIIFWCDWYFIKFTGSALAEAWNAFILPGSLSFLTKLDCILFISYRIARFIHVFWDKHACSVRLSFDSRLLLHTLNYDPCCKSSLWFGPRFSVDKYETFFVSSKFSSLCTPEYLLLVFNIPLMHQRWLNLEVN